MEVQPVPVAVAVGGGLNMASLVGQDELGGGQVHRVFVDDGVIGAGFAVLGHLEQGSVFIREKRHLPLLSSTTSPAGYLFYTRKGTLVLACNIHNGKQAYRC